MLSAEIGKIKTPERKGFFKAEGFFCSEARMKEKHFKEQLFERNFLAGGELQKIGISVQIAWNFTAEKIRERKTLFGRKSVFWQKVSSTPGRI